MIRDIDRIHALFHIVEKVATVAPGFVHISSEAMAELRQLDEAIRKNREIEKGQPVTPAPVGETDATRPIKKDVGVDTPLPPADLIPSNNVSVRSIPADTTYTSDLGAPINQPTLPNLERKI